MRFYLYSDKDFDDYFDYLSFYSKEIYDCLQNHELRTQNVNEANFFFTCISNESNYPIFGKPENGRPKKTINIADIIHKFKYSYLGNHIVFYHSDKGFSKEILNVPYCSINKKDIIMPPPRICKDIYFNDNVKRKYLISFKGQMTRKSFVYKKDNRKNILNKCLQYASDKIIIEDRNSNLHDYNELLQNSLFALAIEGDLPWSYRLTEIINSGVIPIIILPEKHNILPYSTTLKWDDFSILLKQNELDHFFQNKIHEYNDSRIEEMLQNLKNVNNSIFKNRQFQINHLLYSLSCD